MASPVAKAEQILPANAGVDLVSAPEALGKQSARDLKNFLVDRPGKLVPRGPLVGAALGGSVDAVSAVSKPSTLLLGKRDTAVGTRKIFPWEAHLGLPGRTAANETDLVRAHVNLRAVDLATFVASDQAMTDIGLVPGPRSAVLNGLTYAISLDSAGELTGGDTVVLPDGTSKCHKTELLQFDFTGTSLPTFPNPSADVNVTGWASSVGGQPTRDTGLFDSSPASILLQAAGAADTLTTTLSGTFKAGRTYTISWRAQTSSAHAVTITAALGTIGSMSATNAPISSWATMSMTFTPAADTLNPVLTLTCNGNGFTYSLNVDTFTVTQTATTKAGANAPMAAQDVKAYLSRLFVLGGAAPGSTPSALTLKHRTLWWTDPGGPIFSDLNSWKDDVSGLVNQLQVGDDDPSDPGVALGVLPNQLLVFGRRSLWTVLGSSPSNFVVRRVDTVGCLDPRTVVEYQGAVYWLSEQGFMRYDGSSLDNMSRAVQPALLAAADQSVGVGGVAGGTAVVTTLPNGYLLLAIGRRDTNTQLFCGLLHVPTGAWTLLSSGAQSGVIRLAFGASGNGYFADGSTLWLANGATHPERNPLADKGVTLTDVSKDAIVTVPGGVLTVASSSKLPPFWKSRMLQLASPLLASQLQRFLLDHIWIDPAQTADDVSNGWHVSLKNSLGVELAAFDLGTQGTSSTKVRRRYTTQTFPEASSDVYMEISVPGAAPAWQGVPEIYSAALEYAPTRNRAAE